MKKGVSVALSKVLSVKKRRTGRKTTGKRASLFASPARRAILEFLTMHPCCGAARIAEETRVSIPTTQWHLKKMYDAGYLKRMTVEHIDAICPNKLYPPDVLEVCAYFKKKERTIIFKDLTTTPGKSVDEIAQDTRIKPQLVRSVLGKLSRMDLATVIIDGRTKRYYPTDRFNTIYNSARKNWKIFRDWLMKLLLEERLAPKLVRASPEILVIEITTGKKKIEMTLKTDLLSTVYGD